MPRPPKHVIAHHYDLLVAQEDLQLLSERTFGGMSRSGFYPTAHLSAHVACQDARPQTAHSRRGLSRKTSIFVVVEALDAGFSSSTTWVVSKTADHAVADT